MASRTKLKGQTFCYYWTSLRSIFGYFLILFIYICYGGIIFLKSCHMLIWVVYCNIYMSDTKIFIDIKFTWYAQLSGLVLKKRKTIKNFAEKPHSNQEKKLL